MAKKEKYKIKAKPIKQVGIEKHNNSFLVITCIGIIAILTFFVFYPSLQNDFTNWDDTVYIQNNPLVATNQIPVIRIFETPVSGHYHPITIMSLAIDYQFSKSNPFLYHFENVMLHVLNTILIFFFIFLLTRRNLLMAAIVSLFFGIHPMHVESVSWISERKDVLYVFFFVAGLTSYLLYNEKKKKVWYLFAFLLFVLSCLSKEMAIVFPVILLLIDYLKGTKWERKVFIDKIPFFISSIIIFFVEVGIQSGNKINNVQTITVFYRFLFACYSSIMYIIRFFAPYKLSAFYPYPDVHSHDGIPLLFYMSPFILLAIVFTLIYLFIKKEKEIVFGLLFYFVTIALVVQFIPIDPYIVPDRYSYLSYVGLLFIIAFGIDKLLHSKRYNLVLFRYPAIIILVTAAIILSNEAYSRTQVWKNSETLWTDVINNYPNVSTAYKGRADYYNEYHDDGKAIADYSEAIKCDSTYKEAYTNRGMIYFKAGNIKLAISDFSRAIAIDSTYADAYSNRGLVYSNIDKPDLAISDLSRAIAYDSLSAHYHYNRGLIYSQFNDKVLAITDLTKAIELDSSFASCYNCRGLCYLNIGKLNLALSDFTESIKLDPSDASAYSNRAFLNFTRGKNDSVIIDCNEAIAHAPNFALYYYNRALFYQGITQYEKAISDFSSGIQLNPKNVEVYYFMRGKCYNSIQNYGAAITDFSSAIELNPTVEDYYINRSFAENKIGDNQAAKADALKARQMHDKYKKI